MHAPLKHRKETDPMSAEKAPSDNDFETFDKESIHR